MAVVGGGWSARGAQNSWKVCLFDRPCLATLGRTKEFKRVTLGCFTVTLAALGFLGIAEGYDLNLPQWAVVGGLLTLGAAAGPVQVSGARGGEAKRDGEGEGGGRERGREGVGEQRARVLKRAREARARETERACGQTLGRCGCGCRWTTDSVVKGWDQCKGFGDGYGMVCLGSGDRARRCDER